MLSADCVDLIESDQRSDCGELQAANTVFAPLWIYLDLAILMKEG